MYRFDDPSVIPSSDAQRDNAGDAAVKDAEPKPMALTSNSRRTVSRHALPSQSSDRRRRRRRRYA
ncbi:MAG: hypothetical protein AAF719_05445 [Pseudomonadota bacterium]